MSDTVNPPGCETVRIPKVELDHLTDRAESAEAQAAALLDVVDRLHEFASSGKGGGPALVDDLNAALKPQAGARLVARLRALEDVAEAARKMLDPVGPYADIWAEMKRALARLDALKETT